MLRGSKAHRQSKDATCRSLSLDLELERSATSPALARAALARWCEELGVAGTYSQNLILLVSELVSNAVRHSSGAQDAPIGLVATFGEEAIRITVTDAGEGFTPRPRDPARTHGGYGLYLLEKVAERWGVESNGDTKVWFELAAQA